MLGLIDYLDRRDQNWRNRYLLLLDNMSSHKTEETVNLLNYYRVPVRYSAPASFLAIPVEGVFRAIKSCDFRKMVLPEPSPLLNYAHSNPNKRQ